MEKDRLDSRRQVTGGETDRLLPVRLLQAFEMKIGRVQK